MSINIVTLDIKEKREENMENCKFTTELNRLRKSSSDSIDNVEKFDDFKKYMHVVRTAEEDLKEILRKVNASERKTLILLCGSAGDGKSHLLSYLKNADEEHLLDNYVIYNDATESSAPTKTAIETLSELLAPYKDENLESVGKNIILAINLGVLSNFIESEYGEKFKTLKKYVEDSNILTSQVNDNTYDPESYFQYVSFSDYHMYSLTEDGINAEYIEAILKKVFDTDVDNPFYKKYGESCSQCTLSNKCPVKMNYEFMTNAQHQKYVAELLVEIVIRDKFILTTREILNFIFDIVVSRNFSQTKFHQYETDDAKYLKEFLKQITPALLYDSVDITHLMNLLGKYDPLLQRSEEADEQAISYYISANVNSEIKSAFSGGPYKVITEKSMLEKINSDKVLKTMIYSLIVRLNSMDSSAVTEKIYHEYIRDLYFYNAGKKFKLSHLYGMIEGALRQWCSSIEENKYCLENKSSEFVLYEEMTMIPFLEKLPNPEEAKELQRFVPSVVASYIANDNDIINLDIDYSLYEILYNLGQGYIQTADDRNNHADFISFANRMLQTGKMKESVTILSEKGVKAVVSKTAFGFRFKVVK